MTNHPARRLTRLAALCCALTLAAAACGTSESAMTADTTTLEAGADDSVVESTTTTGNDSAAASEGCDDIAASFVTGESANPDLDDPAVAATCDGDNIIVTSNGIPDYTYIETSPGQPRDQGNSFTIPATPTVADSTTDVPLLGSIGVTLTGLQIFGPTEGTGGDVESMPGILSDCGSHNGPSGFHVHLILTSEDTDCLFSPEEVAAGPQLVGYAFDGFPIYTGSGLYTSSWELTDESLFATDTWSAHSYVEGSGDLDECNGRTDEDGNYAYYTTDTFPYILGCYTGEVDVERARGQAAGEGAGGGEGMPERPERPEPPADDATTDDERPERPEPPADA